MESNIPINILQFFDERLEEIKIKQEKELKKLNNFIKGDELLEEIKSIDDKWYSVVQEHVKKKEPLKLIIVGEAPIGFKNFFYVNQGTFLDSLRKYWKLSKNMQLPDEMLNKRILVLDIYKYPIPPDFYKKDKGKILLDENYLNDKINFLINNDLINSDTHFVFRYKRLFKDRELNKLQVFTINNFKFICSNNEIVSFNTEEKPQKLNDTVKKYLIKNCS